MVQKGVINLDLSRMQFDNFTGKFFVKYSSITAWVITEPSPSL